MKSILLYLLLVGIPALGVSALMRLGSRLTAPISVAGTWSVQTNGEVGDGTPCGNPFGTSAHPALTITQSGTHLLMKLNGEAGSVLEGRIDGPNISADVSSHAPTAAVDAAARDIPEVVLRAAVGRRIQPDLLHGELNFVNRPLCADVTFTARRDQVKKIESQ